MYDYDKDKTISNILMVVIVALITAIVTFSLVTIITPMLNKDEDTHIVQSNISSTEMDKYADRIKQALDRISSQYVEDVDIEKLVDGAIEGMAQATDDPYTRYVSEEEYQEMLTEGTGVYSGIGVHVTYDKASDKIMVLGLMPEGPAIKNDIKSGDLITSVDDTAVTKATYNDCIDKLKGEKGTSVKITIQRGAEIIQKEIVREDINENNVSSEILNENIGYIRIWSFDNGVYNQFNDAYTNLRNNNISSLIIDLRDNPGGLVSDTINIAKLLLPECDIVKLVYKDGYEKVYKSDNKDEINIPLVVLVNSRSASASEILSGAIKDSGKGILIGNKTYGKGIVQTVEKLGDKGALSITTSKYYTASGVEIHKNGIEPNISVDLPEDLKNEIAIPKDKDTQLQRAIEYITTGK